MSSSTTEVAMPQMGVSVAEGTLTVWHKQVGDWVETDETICEISTDKIDIEVPSPASGRVVELLVAEEETVPVGTALARIATDAVPGEAHPAEEAGAEAVTRDAAAGTERREPAAAPETTDVRAHDKRRDQLAAPAARDAGAHAERCEPSSAPAQRSRQMYSPVATRIAQEHGIDLASVKGTGRGGRVRKQDVLAAVAGNGTQAPPRADSPQRTDSPERTASPQRADSPQRTEPPLHTESPYRQQSGREPAHGRGARQPAGQPLSRMRRSIADHMTRSLQTAAHCTTIVEADMTGVERARARAGSSPLPFVARAVVEALQEHPALNATLEGDLLQRHHDVNLGIAVSLGDDGLIVPVIHRAQQLSAEGLAERIAELAARARARELTPDEVRGGTFTITNPGGFGSLASTPIINQPQVAILDLEAVTKRAVVIGAADGSDAIAIRPMTFLCLSWDHRALDGAQAAGFLGTVRKRIEVM